MTEPAAKNCPNCGHAVPLGSVVELRDLNLPQGQVQPQLLNCQACGCAFFDPQPAADYAKEPNGGQAALAFYLQQGAGIWSIASTLLPLDLPGPRRMLEVGCGFGFGLDVARSVRGWEVQGFDPSPLAAAGAVQLGIPVQNRYFDAENFHDAPYDVVVCSEVVEHLHSPVEFLRLLRKALLPTGVLVLTTPNAGAITPETSDGILIPLLSVGYHTVIQTSSSLSYALREAGFTNVDVDDRGPSLLARASNAPLPWKPVDEPMRLSFRRYLETAGERVEAASDLGIGLLVRGFREAVAAGDLASAERLQPRIWRDIESRFGATPEALGVGTATTLEELVRQEPLCLGPLLQTRATQLALIGTKAKLYLPLLARAASAADRVRAALNKIGVDDADSEDIAWVARATLLFEAAQAGERNINERLAELGPAPGSTSTSRQRGAVLRRRCFVALVNCNQLEAATSLADVIQECVSRLGGHETLRDDELDALYCGAVLSANLPPGDLETALSRTRDLRAACLAKLAQEQGGSAAGLIWPGLALEATMLRRLNRRAELRDLTQHLVPALASRPGVPPRPLSGEIRAAIGI